MIDSMLDQESSGKAEYVSYSNIKDRFQSK